MRDVLLNPCRREWSVSEGVKLRKPNSELSALYPKGRAAIMDRQGFLHMKQPKLLVLTADCQDCEAVH